MAAWPINPFFAASEEAPLELGSRYCSDPDCDYCKQLREAQDKLRRENVAKAPLGRV